MHLLVAAHDLYPDPGSGGTGRYVYETGRRLAERGHEVTVITRRRGEVPDRERLDGLEVRRYDLTVAGQPWRSIVRQLPDAVGAVRQHLDEVPEPDVVSFQATVTEPIVQALVPDNVPRIAVFHSPWPVEYRIKAEAGGGLARLRRWANEAVRRRIERRGLAASEDVVALSRFMAGQLREVHDLVAEPAIVPGGVDPKTFTPDAGTDARLAEAEPALLTVRRLSPRMGHGPLLHAFARVAEHHPRARLFVAGDGPLREELESEAQRLGVDEGVRFLGHVPDEELPGLYASADAFVLPTQRLEGFGLATLEALAAGTPVVGTPVGATPELLDPLADEPGIPAPLLADGCGAEALADAIAAWAELFPAERAKAGEICRRHVVRAYSWEETAERLAARWQPLAARG